MWCKDTQRCIKKHFTFACKTSQGCPKRVTENLDKNLEISTKEHFSVQTSAKVVILNYCKNKFL